jgi:hypothetical protein
MATSELEILITATNQAKEVLEGFVEGLQEALEEVNNLNKAGKEGGDDTLQKAVDNIGKGLQKAGKEAKKAEKEVSGFQETIGGLAKGLVAGAAAFLSFRAAAQLVSQGIREAAQTQRLDTALRALGQTLGIAEQRIQGTVRAIEAFDVSGSQARDTARRLLQAGVDIAEGSRLAAAAQNLALATGVATDEVLQRITFAIQTGNTALLKRAGISVDLDTAEQKLADSLNKTVSALTDQEKKQALVNAVVAEGAKLQGIAAEAVGNFSTRLSQLPRLTAELAESIGNVLLPGLNELLGAFILFLQNLRQSVQQFAASTNFSEKFSESMRGLANILTAITPAITETLRVVGQLALGLLSLTSSVKGLIAALVLVIRFIPGWGQVITAVIIVIGLLEKAGISVSGVIEGIGKAFDTIATVAELAFFGILDSFRSMGLGIQKFWAQTMRFFGLITKEELDKTTEEINRQRAAIEEEAQFRSKEAFAKLSGKPSPQAEQLIAEREKIKQLNTELLKTEEAVIAAKASGDAAALARASFRRDELVKERAAIEDTIAKVEEQRLAETSLGKDRDKRTQAQAAAAQEEKRIKAVNDAFKTLLQGQGLVATGFVGMSQAGVAAVGQLETVLLDLGERLQSDLPVDLVKTRLAIIAAFGQLKTVDDFTKAIDVLNTAINAGAASLITFRNELQFRQQQAALAQINAELTFFTAALTRIRDIQQVYNDLILAGVQDNIALRQVQAQIANDRKTQAALELQSIAVTVGAARKKFEDEQELIRATAQEQTNLARRSISDTRSQAATIQAIDSQKTQALIKNSKTYYDGLRQAQQQFLQQFQTASQRVRDIDQEIANSRRSTTQTIRDLQRGTLTDDEKQADRRRELREQEDAFNSAALRDDQAAAQAAITRRRELAQQIAGGAGDPKRNVAEAARILEQVQTDSEGLLLVERAAQQEVANTAKKSFEAVRAEIAALVTDIQTLVAQETLSLKVAVDQTSLTSAVNQVTAAFAGLIIPVQVVPVITGVGDQPTVEPQRIGVNLARGGRVPGSSPNSMADNILGWLTAGEWVHPVQAVRYWGEDFMRAISGMRMPRFADGGPIRRFAEGGLVGGVSPGQGKLARAINELSTATSGLRGSKAAFQNEARTPITLDLGSLGTFGVQGDDRTIEALKRAVALAAIKRRRS